MFLSEFIKCIKVKYEYFKLILENILVKNNILWRLFVWPKILTSFLSSVTNYVDRQIPICRYKFHSRIPEWRHISLRCKAKMKEFVNYIHVNFSFNL